MPLYSIGERRVALRGSGQYIAPDASVIGSVTLAQDANIWFKVVIRADNDQVTIGHKVMLHGCTIGDGTLIGINSVVMNGAKIGPATLIGANTLIAEGKEIPGGVLVLGSPGKIVRELKQEEKDYLLKIAAGYVERSRFYQASLTEIT